MNSRKMIQQPREITKGANKGDRQEKPPNQWANKGVPRSFMTQS
jgi:hypothetical protein